MCRNPDYPDYLTHSSVLVLVHTNAKDICHLCSNFRSNYTQILHILHTNILVVISYAVQLAITMKKNFVIDFLAKMFGQVGCFTTLVYNHIKNPNFYNMYLTFANMKKVLPVPKVALKTCELFFNGNKELKISPAKNTDLALSVSHKKMKKFILIFFSTSSYLAGENINCVM